MGDGWYTMRHRDEIVEYAVHLTTHGKTNEQWVQGFGLLSETLENYIARGYTFTRLVPVDNELLKAVKLAYRKHHLGDESVGWDELSETLMNVLCETMGDEEFQVWIKTAKKG